MGSWVQGHERAPTAHCLTLLFTPFPSKPCSMKAVVARYVGKDMTALDRFPDGSE